LPGVEDETRIGLRCANGIPVYYTVGGMATAFLVEGTKGAVTEGGKTDPLELAKKLPSEASQLTVPDLDSGFLKCVRTREKRASDVEIGARTVTICHRTVESFKRGLLPVSLWQALHASFRRSTPLTLLPAESASRPGGRLRRSLKKTPRFTQELKHQAACGGDGWPEWAR
jgi:hypothetical protein